VRSFNVYERSDGKCKAVKNGWSWPGFFFGSIWALCMQIWLIGLLLLPAELILNILMSVTEQMQRDASGSYSETRTITGGLIALMAFSIRIIFGLFGNTWKRKRLEKIGYKLKITHDARSIKDAIYLYPRVASKGEASELVFQKENILHNQPLSSSDQGKLLIFSLLLAPSIVFLVGVIPAIFLVFGIYMMKKNQEFSSIDTAVKNFKGYTWLALIGCALSSLYFGYKFFTNKSSWNYDDGPFLISMMFSAISIVYLIAVQFLFYSPLKKHSEWVAVNGIFSTKPKSATKTNVESELDIIKGEKLKQYSVADELIKWAKLKEDGHISEDDFNEARLKLLKRN
jgi:hypothetical protein